MQIRRHIRTAKISSIHSKWIGKAKIPIPTKEEQEKIVDVLDRFNRLTTDLTVGLPAELNARRKQYEYYRNKLLTFKELKTS